MSRKPTWLYAVGTNLPELDWSKGAQRLHPVALKRYGYEKARRIGMTAMVGGKDKTRIRNATPAPFRDLLISMVRSAVPPSVDGGAKLLAAAAGDCCDAARNEPGDQGDAQLHALIRKRLEAAP